MSLQPAKINFTIWKGATFFKRITVYTDNTKTTARNLTGYSALLEIKDRANGTVLYTLSTGNGRIILGGTNGTVDLKIADDDTATLTWTSGVFDLIITDPASDSDAILYGGFKVQGI